MGPYVRDIRSTLNPPQSLAKIRLALLDAWQNIDEMFIRNLILSMPNRCQTVINAREGNTRY